MKQVLILGIGNILQSDDGLGVHLIQDILESHPDLPENIEVVDGGTAGFDLIPLMSGKDKIVIVDALKTDDNPGSIYRFTPENAVATRSGFSLHEVGMMEIIRTLRLMGENPEIEIVGIVPEDISTLEISVSPAVKNAFPRAIEVILESALN